MWINDTVKLGRVLAITATLNSGTYTLRAVLASDPSGGVTLDTFGSQGAAQSALDDLFAVVGYPWTLIGSLGSVANSQNSRVLAVNLDNVAQMASVTDGEGSGLSFNAGWRSAGFSPYANSGAAIAGIKALTGSVVFP